MLEMKGKYTTAKIMIDQIEQTCIDQIQGFLDHPAFTNPVAIMSDCHAGKGSVVGFTMLIGEKTVPNVVGVDIGCFTGDTQIPLLNGMTISLKKLTQKKSFWVYSNDNGKVVPGKAVALKTRVNAELIEVVISGGTSIKCTPDQEFLLFDGSYKEAHNLKPLDSLMPLYRTYQTGDGYEFVKSKARGQLTHHMVYEFFNGKKPPKFTIHHKDLTWYNNDPENLELLSGSEHSKLHRKIDGGGPFKREDFKKKRLKILKQKGFFKKELLPKKQKVAIKNIQGYNKSPQFKKSVKFNGQRGAKYLIKFNKINNKTEYDCHFCQRKIKGKGGLKRHEQNCPQKNNHKVLYTKKLPYKQDVYCLKVEKFRNFALASGVFVHNCGMTSANLGPDLKLPLDKIDLKIRHMVPFGFDTHDKSILDMKTDFPWHKARSEAQKFALAYKQKFDAEIETPFYDLNWFMGKCQHIGCDIGRAIKSLGTLGGGNHFIEIGIDTKGNHWLTIHTGSRNFGKCICEYWQERAIKKVNKRGKEDRQQAIKELKETYKGKELYDRIKALKDAPITESDYSDDLCWIEGDDALGYLYDMVFSQIYAEENRARIMATILDILKIEPLDKVETVHNFIDFKDFIIRKGAIRSYIGERMIIPFNMRDGILICEGKSNPDWNYSAPHGAGRVLSRGQARKRINLETFKTQMQGIFSTSVGQGTLDEAPDAYKDCRVIEEAIEPTATIIDRIKPILNMKATEKEWE